jgi:hypothetical protein
MFLEIVLAIGAYRILRRRKWRLVGRRHVAKAKDRSEALGEAGETLARQELHRTLASLCGTDYYLSDGPLIIEHAPGTRYPTAEIDHLAVTPFGVFVFETKNWSGRIGPSTASGFVTRTGRNGCAEDRRSPLDQNRTKVAFFRSRLPPLWPVTGAGLFVSREADVDPALHSDLLSLADLPHWMRSRRDAYSGMPPIDVRKAMTGIAPHLQSSRAALEEHTSRVRDR